MSLLSTQQEQTSSMMSAFAKAGDLKKRILFTILALVVFRFGIYVPLPGINIELLKNAFNASAAKGFLDMFDTFAGGALSHMSILALNITPYISASIIVQLAAYIFEPLKALRKDGEAGRRKMNQYTRYLAIIVTIAQAFGLAITLEHMSQEAIIMPSVWLFRITTIVSILAGSFFVIWLGDQITQRGIGNGTSLIITVGILAEMPRAFIQLFEMGKEGAISSMAVVGVLAMTLVLFFTVVFFERAQRRIVIQSPKGLMANRQLNMKSSYLPLKINSSGVMPPIFASALLILPLTVIKFFSNSKDATWAKNIELWLNHGTTLYWVVYALLIIFCTFFYTNLIFNPKEIADNLKKNGSFIAGIRPGEGTANYLKYVMTRLTVIGAVYLTALCIMPQVIASSFGVSFVLGGTSLLIVVTTLMETLSQVQSHLMAVQYESLIRKAKLKGRI